MNHPISMPPMSMPPISLPPMPMPIFMPPGAGAGPHSALTQVHGHLECAGCQTLLMYPQGAGNVRCSRCTHITPAPPASTETAQIVCNGCRLLLSYLKGAQSVQCSMCHVVTQVPAYGHLVCGGCSIMLMYPTGAESVKCSVCHYVTGINNTEQQPEAPAPRTLQNWEGSGKGNSPPVSSSNATVGPADNGSTGHEQEQQQQQEAKISETTHKAEGEQDPAPESNPTLESEADNQVPKNLAVDKQLE